MMSKNQQALTSSESSGSNGIPPPPDPFPTNQTPFPRTHSSSDDTNPFVLFRRYADSQVSAIFAKLPSLLGYHHKSDMDTSQIRGRLDPQHKMVQSPSRFGGDISDEGLQKIDDCGQLAGSEGQRKRIEQELEEVRMQHLNRTNFVKSALERMDTLSQDSEAGSELALYESLLNPFISPLAGFQMKPESHRLVQHSRQPEGDELFDPAISEPHAFLWWTNSPYSPLRLQNEDKKLDSKTQTLQRMDWNAAFQELIRNQELNDTSGSHHEQDPYKAHLLSSYDAARHFRGLDGPLYDGGLNREVAALNWMDELHSALQKSWPYSNKEARSPAAQAGADSNSDSHSAMAHGAISWPNDHDTRKDNVLYNTTSTNRRTLPDGTIETKIVKVIGYRDGSEKKSESIRFESPPFKQSVPHQASVALMENKPKLQNLTETIDARKEARAYGKGWFWN